MFDLFYIIEKVSDTNLKFLVQVTIVPKNKPVPNVYDVPEANIRLMC